MKEGWKYKRLGEVATYINGFAFKPTDWGAEGKPIIRIQNLTGSHPKFNRCNRDDIPSKYIVRKGDILISWSATLGVFEWNEEDALLNQHIFKVVFDKERINKNYFKYAILTSIGEMSRHTNGATMRHIRKGDFDNIIVPIPPISEQPRIVDYLDAAFAQIDELKANSEKQLADAHALFQSALTEALQPKPDWQKSKFKDVIVNLRTGLNPRTHFKLNTDDAEGYYITVRELKGFNFEVDRKTDRINEYAIKRINERSNLKMGDVLYSGTGTIGRTALVQELPTWWNIKEGVYAITPKTNVLDSSFLIYLMHSEYFKSEVLSKTSGTTVRSIPMKELKEITIPLPPIDEQHSIVHQFDIVSAQIHELEEISNKNIAECDALKQALLRQVFE